MERDPHFVFLKASALSFVTVMAGLCVIAPLLELEHGHWSYDSMLEMLGLIPIVTTGPTLFVVGGVFLPSVYVVRRWRGAAASVLTTTGIVAAPVAGALLLALGHAIWGPLRPQPLTAYCTFLAIYAAGGFVFGLVTSRLSARDLASTAAN